MEDARYPQRCQYILDAAKRHNHQLGKTLDLCCGTGSLTLLLAKSGVDVFGIDGSVEMLSVAFQKRLEQGEHILFVNQRMQELELAEKIDTCVCTLDSINHLTDESDVQKTFDGVAKYMNTGGLFIFDVNTVFKHRNVLADNVFVLESERVFCVWQNFLRENDVVDVSLDFFEEEKNGLYSRCSDYITERAYSLDVIKNLLTESGFEVLGCFGDLTFEAPKDDEQRVVFTAAKK